MPIFLLLFIVMPIVEMAILIKVGGVIGALNTVGLVVLTAVVGAAMLKRQGLATLMRANQRMNTGEIPAREMAEGLLLAIGGVLLMTPGFVTDAIGFACLLPGTRHVMAAHLLKRMVVQGQAQTFHFHTGGGFQQRDPFRRPGESGDIIEGEFEEERNKDGSGPDRLEKK